MAARAVIRVDGPLSKMPEPFERDSGVMLELSAPGQMLRAHVRDVVDALDAAGFSIHWPTANEVRRAMRRRR